MIVGDNPFLKGREPHGIVTSLELVVMFVIECIKYQYSLIF